MSGIWENILHSAKSAVEDEKLECCHLMRDSKRSLLQEELLSLPKNDGTKEIISNFRIGDSWTEARDSLMQLNIGSIFQRGPSSSRKEELRARDIMGRQETTGALNDLAKIATERAEFLCIEGALYYFDGCIWTLIRNEQEIAIALSDVLPPEITANLSKYQFRELMFKIKIIPAIQRNWEDIPIYENLIAGEDGVLDLDTGDIRDSIPEDYLFSQNHFYCHEIDRGCGEYFEHFMENICDGDRNIRQIILEMIGVVISRYRPRKFFLLIGEPKTGKSQLAKLLELIVGKSSTHSVDTPDGIGARFATGSLIGKRLCICGDAENAPISTKAVAVIKQITGGDPILVERKGEQAFSMVCETALVFCSNHKLKLGHDSGFWDRIVAIPFTSPVPASKAIPNYAQLIYEKDCGYIVGEAIRALISLRERGFCFTYVENNSLEEQAAYLADPEIVVTRFIADRCAFQPEEHILSSELYSAYCAYCDYRHEQYMGYSAFGRAFSKQCPHLERTNLRGGRGFRGICIKNVE